jgi:RsiW-degrading membrane proteinase PrsW (M82 family)
MGYATICSIAIFTPFIEEFAKAYALFYRHGETGRSIFSLGFLIGLGFGLTEFLLYVIVLEGSFLVRLPGIFFHAASTSITAYGIAKKKYWIFYLVAVALHVSNNITTTFDHFWIVVGPLASWTPSHHSYIFVLVVPLSTNFRKTHHRQLAAE